jgi:hypothetical protein
MDFNKFKGFYPTLDRALSIVPNHMIHSLVFSRREDEFSVGLIMHQRGEEYQAKFEELIGYVLGPEWYEAAYRINVAFVCADLSSIGTDSLRIYKNQPQNIPQGLDSSSTDDEDWHENLGYYINPNTGEILGTKHYIRSQRDSCYKIDYYDKDNNLILKGQKEIMGEYEDWNGPREIYNIAINAGVRSGFAKKVSKDQGYFIVHRAQ